MGGKNQYTIRCPKCKKEGILRFKQRGKSSVVVSHYDKQLYKSGTKGTKTCYIGSMNRISRIFEESFGEEYKEESKYFVKMCQRLDSENKDNRVTKRRNRFGNNARQPKSTPIPNTLQLNEDEFKSDGLQKLALILNEVRKIRILKEKQDSIGNKKLEWCIRCHNCRTGIKLDATFRGADKRYPINVNRARHTHIYFQNIDASKDVVWNPFFDIFLQPSVFSSF